MQAIDPNGVPYAGTSAVTASNGTFGVCLPEQGPFTVEVMAASYPTTFVAEMEGVEAQQITQLGLISSDFLTAISPLFPGGYNPALGTVVVKVNSTLECHPAEAGWTVGLTFPDGGSLPDGGYQLVYIAGGVPMTGLTATQAAGAAVLYNIDTSLSTFFVVTYGNPDAGGCEPTNTAFGLTGRVYVTGNALAVFPILLP